MNDVRGSLSKFNQANRVIDADGTVRKDRDGGTGQKLTATQMEEAHKDPETVILGT